jgi:hypothetical protein
MVALAAILVGCSRQPPHQAATESCTDERQFDCLHGTAAPQPIAFASLKTEPPTETKRNGEKPPSLRVRDRAAHFIAKKPKLTGITAKTEPAATRIPPSAPSLRTQLEPKISAAGADLGTTGQPTVGLVAEQVAAATGVAERMTEAALAAARGDVKAIGDESLNKTDLRVAVVMTRPEIKSVTDLAGKSVAMDERYSASSVDVRIAFVVAGAASVELTAGHPTAIDRLNNGEVPAAVLALVSAEAAEGFPEVAGFKIFRVPLLPPAVKARP